MDLRGLKIVPHNLALNHFTEWRVQKHSTEKRRRNWRVVKVTVTKPGCFIACGVAYVHPTLYEKLKELK